MLDHGTAVRMMKTLHSSPIRNMILLRVMFQTMPAWNDGLAMSGISFRHYPIGTLLVLPLPIVLDWLLTDYLGQILPERLSIHPEQHATTLLARRISRFLHD